MIFFVNAPVQLFHKVMPLIEAKKPEKLTIVTVNDLAPFFRRHTHAKVIVPKVDPNLVTMRSKKKIFTNIIRSKLEYKKLFSKFKGEEVYFTHTSWSVVQFSYIKKLARHNKVFLYSGKPYMKSGETTYDLYKEEHSLRALFMRWLAKVFLGVDVYIKNKGGRPVWELKVDKFPCTVVDNYDAPSFKKVISKSFIKDKFMEGKSLLFLSSDITTEGFDEDEVDRLTDKLINIFDKKHPSGYVIKAHPRDGKLFGSMVGHDAVVDAHIISETLLNHDWQYVLGYYSEALMTAKENTDAKVICTINLLTWANPSLKEYWTKEYNNVGICIPDTIEELEELLC